MVNEFGNAWREREVQLTLKICHVAVTQPSSLPLYKQLHSALVRWLHNIICYLWKYILKRNIPKTKQTEAEMVREIKDFETLATPTKNVIMVDKSNYGLLWYITKWHSEDRILVWIVQLVGVQTKETNCCRF